MAVEFDAMRLAILNCLWDSMLSQRSHDTALCGQVSGFRRPGMNLRARGKLDRFGLHIKSGSMSCLRRHALIQGLLCTSSNLFTRGTVQKPISQYDLFPSPSQTPFNNSSGKNVSSMTEADAGTPYGRSR